MLGGDPVLLRTSLKVSRMAVLDAVRLISAMGGLTGGEALEGPAIASAVLSMTDASRAVVARGYAL